MKNLQILNACIFSAFIGASGTASAALTSPITIDFDTPLAPSAVFGHPNDSPASGGGCPVGFGSCYYEPSGGSASVAIGATSDSPNNPGSHLHGVNYFAGTNISRGLAYHSDSSGIFIRMVDSSAFSIVSMLFMAPINLYNPDTGESDYWDVLGYSFATDPTLSTDGATPVATQTVANGYNSSLSLSSDFGNISSLWIHYNGFPQQPTDGKLF